MGRGKKKKARCRNNFVALGALGDHGDQDISELVSSAKSRASTDVLSTRDEDREKATLEAADNADTVTELFFSGIPSGTSCTDIVKAIVRVLRRCRAESTQNPWDNAAIENRHILSNCPVVRCEIKKTTRRGFSNATAALETEYLADLVRLSGSLPIRGYSVKVSISKYPTLPGVGSAWRTRPDPGSVRWKVDLVQVGRRLDQCTFATFWESSPFADISEDCIVEINPVTHVIAIITGRKQTMLKGQQDMLSFSKTSAMLRIELPFRHILDAPFGEPLKGSSGKFAAFISFARPPRLFRSESPALDLMAPKNIHGSGIWDHKAGYLPEVRWVRTVDPTVNQSFSRATWIRLMMSSREFTSFFKQLHNWCITHSQDPVMITSRTVRDREKLDMISLFDAAKKLNIPFELRYSAACVFSFGQINLKNVTFEFWRILAQDMREDDARLVLQAMYEECSRELLLADDVDPIKLLYQCMERCNVRVKKYNMDGIYASVENESSSEELTDGMSSYSSDATEEYELDMLMRNLELNGPSFLADRVPQSPASSEAESAIQKSSRKAPHLTHVRRLVYTPTRCLVLPPEEDLLNRVLREFAQFGDRFLRVSFTDEDLGSVGHTGSLDLFTRIRVALRDGVEAAGEKFVFLAFSNSQLRDHGVWMYNESPSLAVQPPSADAIRKWMGNFSHIRVPAKFAARQGQAFSSTVGTIIIDEGHQIVVNDVLGYNERYTFSDGVGTISLKLATKVARRLRLSHVPSIFQVRFGGAKGVLAVWDQALQPGIDIALRPSMKKFESEHRRLEIVGYSKRLPAYLNRQLIVILSTMGVPDVVFEEKQDRFLHRLNLAMKAEGALEALNLLYTAGHSDSGVKLRASSPMMSAARFFQAGLTCVSCEHLFNMMNAFRRRVIKDLMFRARIPVDSDKGVCLFGIMDELGVLAEDEVFCQFTEPCSGRSVVVTGKVLVGRNPCLHPGDIQLLNATNNLCLRHLKDAIVFPRRGVRPIPSMLSGGDLDGDIYFCLFDNDLTDNIVTGRFSPMDYTAPTPATLNRDVKTEDIASFFVDYIRNDRLGQIANAHLVYSDKERMGARSAKCLRLAMLHSTAVDFAKTGIPAEFPRSLMLKNVPGEFPDFLGKHRRVSYRSDKVLGKMYRACSTGKGDPAHGRPFRPNPKSGEIDAIIDGIPVGPEMLQEAEKVCKAYNYDLDRIMEEFGVQTEGEVISGEVLSFTERHAELRARKDYDLRTRLNRRATELRNSYRRMFYKGLQDRSQVTEETIVRACSWHKACRKVASADRKCGEVGKVSFPWVVADVLLRVIESERDGKKVSS